MVLRRSKPVPATRLRSGAFQGHGDDHPLVLLNHHPERHCLEQLGGGDRPGAKRRPHANLIGSREHRIGRLDDRERVGPRRAHHVEARIEILAGEQRLIRDEREGPRSPLVGDERVRDHVIVNRLRELALHSDRHGDQSIEIGDDRLFGGVVRIRQLEVTRCRTQGERGDQSDSA